ncbi:MAG: site-2 protease family protein [Clostridia bacterium]|nr:site-2 protease family protein [Clostridia bacterium]
MYSSLLSIGSAFIKIGYVMVAILILMLMITIHELGHYTAGKILKFKINEFSIGFGKAIFTKKKKNGEVFSIRLIPLGGYCAFEGEDTENENPDSFNAQAPWKRLIVLFCGAFFNFLSAIIFSVILLSVVGNGQVQVTALDTASNTHIETLQVGDVITHVNGEKISFFNGGLTGLTQEIKDETDISLTVVRNGEKQEVIVQKYATMVDGKESYKFGIDPLNVGLPFGEAVLQSVPFSCETAWECLVVLGKLIIGDYGLEAVGGPITTIGTIADAGSVSALYLLLYMPLIAVNLAVFNLLPIPALDGAKMVFVLIEWIRKKPINRDLENKIHMVGLIILFGFVILVDLLQLFT